MFPGLQARRGHLKTVGRPWEGAIAEHVGEGGGAWVFTLRGDVGLGTGGLPALQSVSLRQTGQACLLHAHMCMWLSCQI